MGLQAEGAPDTLHAGDRYAAGLGHAARTPVGGVRRQALQGAYNHRLDPRVLEGARRPGAGLVSQTLQPMLGKAPAPLADSVLADAKSSSHLLVLIAIGAAQD